MALTKTHNRMAAGAFKNVLDYGAVGDGVTDDTAAIQAAITAAQGNVLYFPSGTYLFSEPLYTEYCSIFGDGQDETILKASGSALSASLHALSLGKQDNNVVRLSYHHDFALAGDGSTGTNYNGLAVKASWFGTFSRIKVYNFSGIGMKAYSGSYWNTFEDVNVGKDNYPSVTAYPTTGVFLEGISGAGFNSAVFNSCYFNGANYGLDTEWCDNLVFNNLEVTGPDVGVRFTANVTNIVVNALYAETNATACIVNNSATNSIYVNGVSRAGSPTLYSGTKPSTLMERAGTFSEGIVLAKDDLAMTYNLSIDTSTETLQVISSRAGAAIRNMQLGSDVTLSVNGTASIITSGTGSPEGAVTAPIGSLFMRTDGGAGTSLYVKESGAGNTGWAAK